MTLSESNMGIALMIVGISGQDGIAGRIGHGH